MSPAQVMPRAISYTRFSTPEQAKGASANRQIAYAKEYCERNGLLLVPEDEMRDEGLSAYKGHNKDKGALADFLEAVKSGAVEPGTFLLVETLDRLSRQRPQEAGKLLDEIVQQGINVVTLVDGKVYTKENIDNLDSVLHSTLLFVIAHEESRRKSDRVRDARKQFAERSREGRHIVQRSGHRVTGQCPSWLVPGPDGYEVIEERAQIIRRALEEYANGKGPESIAKEFNRAELPTWKSYTQKEAASQWRRAHIYEWLQHPAVIGERRVRLAVSPPGQVPVEYEEQEPIKDYYPAIVSRELWELVQARRGQAANHGKHTGGRPAARNPLSGLLKCTACGGTVTLLRKNPRYSYLRCKNSLEGGPCKEPALRFENVEPMLDGAIWQLLNECPTNDKSAKWSAELEAVEGKLDDELDAVATITDLLIANPRSIGLNSKLMEVEKTAGALQERQAELTALIEQHSHKVVDSRLQNAIKLMEPDDGTRDIATLNEALKGLWDSCVIGADDNLIVKWHHATQRTSAPLLNRIPVQESGYTVAGSPAKPRKSA